MCAKKGTTLTGFPPRRFARQGWTLYLLILLLLTGCAQAAASGIGSPTPAPTASMPVTETTQPPTLRPSLTPAPPDPTVTLTASPTATPSPTATASPSPTPSLTPTPLAYDRLPYITLSNAARLAQLARIPAGPEVVLPANFAFAPDSRRLALDGGLTVQIYDILSGQTIGELLPPDETYTPAGSLAYSPDGKKIARVYRQNRVVVWDVDSREVIQELRAGAQTQALFKLAFPSASRLAASAGTDGGSGLIVWDTASGEIVAETASGSYQPDDFIISPLGRMIVQAGRDGTLRFWEAQTGRLVSQQIIYACQDTLNGAAFSPDGHILALQCETEGTRLYLYIPHYTRSGDMSLLNVQDSEWQGNGLMSFNRDGALLAAAIGKPPGQILFWNMWSHEQLMMVDDLSGDVRQIAFSPDGRLLAFRLGDGSIELWGAP